MRSGCARTVWAVRVGAATRTVALRHAAWRRKETIWRQLAYYYQTADTVSEEEREKLILEHLPQVRLVARKIHERLPDSVCFDDLLPRA